MTIGVLGLNHRTAPVELRERCAFQTHQVPHALKTLRNELSISECVILSTCNRVELYTLLPEQAGFDGRLKNFIAQFHQLEPDLVTDRFYWYDQPDSVRHLFRVTAGLDSMVLGESEILGQVRDAYSQAVSCGTVGSVFHRLFQTAIRTGKDVRSKTKIGCGAISISSVAVELAHRIFQDLKKKTILVIGAGAMAETTLQCLKGQGVGSVVVANRSQENAVGLAHAVHGQALPLTELESALTSADIVICSTSADRYLLTASQVHQKMAMRHQRPLFLIDISVPRNLDPAIGTLENVYLYNIDDLEGIVSSNRQMRQNEVSACSAIVETHMEQFLNRHTAWALK